MRNDKFIKHDASAANDDKLMILIEREGLKGYGAYWVILEMLRNQSELKAPYSILGVWASRMRVHKKFLLHIVLDFGLFCCEEEVFYSSGMMRRMAKYLSVLGIATSEQSVKSECNVLSDSEKGGVNAREQERIGKESNNIIVDENHWSGQIPICPYPGWEAFVDQMAASESFMERVGMHSGMGELFIRCRPRIVALFKDQILLQGKQAELMTLGKTQAYFSNFLADGSITNKKLREKLRQEERRVAEQSPTRFEEIIDGQRTYLGHPIPSYAPPRPDATAVWDDVLRKWIH